MTTATATAKKITLATFKAFISKNAGKLYIRVDSAFDGMVDGCRSTGDHPFTPALPADRPSSNNLGIQGVWMVGGSRNWFGAFESGELKGIEVSNCCGSFVLAVRK